MIAALLFLSSLSLQAADTVSRPADAAAEDIIVVTGRLKQLSLDLGTDRGGKFRCRIRRTSGDRAFDRAACDASWRCVQSGVTRAEDMRACLQGEMLTVTKARRETNQRR